MVYGYSYRPQNDVIKCSKLNWNHKPQVNCSSVHLCNIRKTHKYVYILDGLYNLQADQRQKITFKAKLSPFLLHKGTQELFRAVHLEEFKSFSRMFSIQELSMTLLM